MKKHAYFIGIDNGGSAIKAAVFNENGRELSVSQVQIPMDHPNPGWTERDPHAVWRGNCQVIRDAIGKAQICAQNIKGVSVCGYGGGLGLLDSANSPIAPFIVSTDTRRPITSGRIFKKQHQQQAVPADPAKSLGRTTGHAASLAKKTPAGFA